MDGNLLGTQSSKQKFRGNSSDEGSVVWKEIIREELKIVLKFSKEDGGVQLSPIIFLHELKKRLGEVTLSKILIDGSLLIAVVSVSFCFNIPTFQATYIRNKT